MDISSDLDRLFHNEGGRSGINGELRKDQEGDALSSYCRLIIRHLCAGLGSR